MTVSPLRDAPNKAAPMKAPFGLARHPYVRSTVGLLSLTKGGRVSAKPQYTGQASSGAPGSLLFLARS